MAFWKLDNMSWNNPLFVKLKNVDESVYLKGFWYSLNAQVILGLRL